MAGQTTRTALDRFPDIERNKVRKPFAELIEELKDADQEKTLGELSEELNEPIGRIMDALDVIKWTNLWGS